MGIGVYGDDRAEEKKLIFRATALEWLGQILKEKKSAYESGKLAPSRWKHVVGGFHDASGLEPVREETSLNTLPARERDAWRSFWSSVNELIQHCK